MRVSDQITRHLQAEGRGTVPDAGPPVLLEAALQDDVPLRGAGIQAGGSVWSTQRFDQSQVDALLDQGRTELMLSLQERVKDDSKIIEIKKTSGAKNDITLGRASHADIVLNDATISSIHARFEIESRVYLKDNESSNGTFVNRQQLEPFAKTALRSGDCVRFGKRVFYFVPGDRLVLFIQLRIANRKR